VADEPKGPEEKSIEMRVTELEDRLRQLHVSEEELRAYQKVSRLMGSAGASPAAGGQVAGGCIVDCVVSGCLTECLIRACTVVRACTIVRQCQCVVRQCTWECYECQCAPGGGGFGAGGGFGTLGG
jgi:hypothetical protein